MNNVPHGIKYNNRYRGPHESYKVNSSYVQARYNLNKLKDKIEHLELIKKNIIEKPKNINNITSSISSILVGIDNTIEKIMNYEVNNINE